MSNSFSQIFATITLMIMNALKREITDLFLRIFSDYKSQSPRYHKPD